MNYEDARGFIADPPLPDLGVKALALEARPFFLNDDPIYFPALVKLQSFGQSPEVAVGFRAHTKRWTNSAFGGVMGIRFGALKLDVVTVVSTWFNSDYFHTVPQKPEQIVLRDLAKAVGGEDQARALLVFHLMTSADVASEFFDDVVAISAEFRAWALKE